MNQSSTNQSQSAPRLKRVLKLRDLVLYGIILIQPTAPMPLFGVVGVEAKGHVVTTVLIGMVAMMLTAVSFGRMARAYPSAGSAYTYVGREIHPHLGLATGWSMAMEYVLNPVICTIWCAKAAQNILPLPYAVWAVFFAALFTTLNLMGMRATARTNAILAGGMSLVILAFFVTAVRYVVGTQGAAGLFSTKPFYDPQTFSWPVVWTGTSICVLTYIGFDGISTLAEDVENPRRNVLLATVLTCFITGVLGGLQVYLGQLVWPDYASFPDPDTGFVSAAGRAGGAFMFQLVNLTLLVATIGSGSGAQLGASRLLYGMGRDNVLPRGFFGYLDPRRNTPRYNLLLVGAISLAGALAITYQFGAELLIFGAFIAFMGVNLASLTRYYVRAGGPTSKGALVASLLLSILLLALLVLTPGLNRVLGSLLILLILLLLLLCVIQLALLVWMSSFKDMAVNLLPPLAGFLICLYIWWSLRPVAKIAGACWLLAGIAYSAWKTNFFRRQLILPDLPPEE